MIVPPIEVEDVDDKPIVKKKRRRLEP